MSFSFLQLVRSAGDSYDEIFATLKHKIAKLHSLTSYRTFYEFFNLSEGCSDSEIKKAFRKLKRSAPSKGMSKAQFDELIMYGYSLLVNYRKAYDGFLRDSKYFYMDEPANYKNYVIVIIIAILFFLIFVDFVIYSFKYLRYLEMTSAKKKENDTSALKKNQKQLYLNPPMILSSRIYYNGSKLFSRRQ